MARQHHADAVYRVADLFRDRCLTGGRSLLWPDRQAWTPENVDALWDAFMGHPDTGKESFLEKWRKQLADRSPDVHRVAADALALYYLFPAQIGRAAKLAAVEKVIGWKLAAEGDPPDFPLLAEAFEQGIGHGGIYYSTGQPQQVAFYLRFARRVLEDRVDPRDAEASRRLADAVVGEVKGSASARHVLLHLLFPDRFESISSKAHKDLIVATFPEEAAGADDVDDALFNIRRALGQELGKPDFDFYDDADLYERWNKPKATSGATDKTPNPDPRQSADAARAAVEAIYPDPAVRLTCLTLLADAVERAHAVSPASWGVTLHPNRVRLNVGEAQASVLRVGGPYLVLDRDALDPPLRQRVDAEMAGGPWSGAVYASMPYAYGAHLPSARLEELLPLVREAHLRFVERSAGQVRTRIAFYRSHSPGVLAYLREELGRDLPDPVYALDNGTPPSGPRWWVEKTHTRGWDYRNDGPFAVGRALAVPTRAANGADVYRSMREARPGDAVLHFTDLEAITGLSRVAGPAEEIDTLPGFDWDLPRSYVVPLADHRPLDPPLPREVLFGPPHSDRLAQVARSSGASLFYAGDDELRPKGGAYLTPAPPELVAILREAYRGLSGRDLVPADWDDVLVDRPVPEPSTLAPPTLDDLAAATHLDRAELEELEGLLLDKKQLVLEGPPGSGKTYLADLLARWFVGAPLTGEADERVETVQFHQSYGYEDFVQGIRPVTDEGGQLRYRVVPGIFARLCGLAARNPDRRFVLVVDEINRGNLARIFGELLLLLEYRDKRVRLPYGAGDDGAGASLAIPRNLYLIGTMNATDRSLALIDYALRRRFYFYRLLPVAGGRAPVLERWLEKQDLPEEDRRAVLGIFLALNARIERELSADFQVGHSYFMRHDLGTPAGLDRLWRRAVLPLLEEYFHGARDRDAALAGFAFDRLLAASEAAQTSDGA